MLNQAVALFGKSQPMLAYALMGIGCIKLVEHGVGLARGVWKHLLRPRRWLKSRYGRKNVEPWAVITGKFCF